MKQRDPNRVQMHSCRRSVDISSFLREALGRTALAVGVCQDKVDHKIYAGLMRSAQDAPKVDGSRDSSVDAHIGCVLGYGFRCESEIGT